MERGEAPVGQGKTLKMFVLASMVNLCRNALKLQNSAILGIFTKFMTKYLWGFCVSWPHRWFLLIDFN